MGYCDAYCTICGGGLRNSLRTEIEIDLSIKEGKTSDEAIKDIMENNDMSDNIKEEDVLTIKKDLKKHNWLGKLYILHKKEKIKATDEDHNWPYYKIKNDGKYIITIPNDKYYEDLIEDNTIPCLVVHRDCYKFIKKKLNISLTYKKLVKLNVLGFGGILKKTKDYKKMETYAGAQIWEQIEIICSFIQGDGEKVEDLRWLLKSPLKNKKNGKRIKKIWKKILG